MPKPNAVATTGDKQLSERQLAVVQSFIQLVNQVPEADAGDITDLLGPILAAATWEELNQADALPSSKTLVDKELRLESIARKVSDKPSLTGYYLFCEGIDLTTGEKLRWTAGCAQAVAVMSQLHVLRELPAKIVYKAVATDGEGDAINCKVLDVYHGARIDA
jgi:hypothetical protein